MSICSIQEYCSRDRKGFWRLISIISELVPFSLVLGKGWICTNNGNEIKPTLQPFSSSRWLQLHLGLLVHQQMGPQIQPCSQMKGTDAARHKLFLTPSVLIFKHITVQTMSACLSVIFHSLFCSRRWWLLPPPPPPTQSFSWAVKQKEKAGNFAMLFNVFWLWLASWQQLWASLMPTGLFLLPRYVFLSLFIALIFFARYSYMCRKEGGRDAIPYRGIQPCAFMLSWWHFVFAVWPSHQSCVCLILTSALCRKRWWTGWSKQSKLMSLEGTWAHARLEHGSVSAREPPALLLSLNVGNQIHLSLL